MSRIVSTIRRAAGTDLAQDVCGFVAIATFLAVAVYGSAGLSMLVTAWRLGQ